MTIRSASDIKRSQKESLLLRTLSQLYHQASCDDKELQQAYITRVQLSPSKTVCTVYFYMIEGEDAFNKIKQKISLYKPSMRKALAREINGRYTCELAFRFDEQFEKTQKIERLLDTIAGHDQTQEE
ncbi:MAG: ribosome-binding factor A [Candidatus Babeliaceae bacterium]|nr:ribosome-binding factor A [Candidatus Babeliaceae bacterium]